MTESANMTEEQEKHLADIKTWLAERVDPKYRAGQREHGGNLWLKPCLPLLIEEVIDLPVYVQTLERQLREMHDDLQNAIASKDWCGVASVLARLSGQLRPPVDR